MKFLKEISCSKYLSLNNNINKSTHTHTHSSCINTNGDWEFTEPEFETTSGGDLPEICDNEPGSCPVGAISSTICLLTCEQLMN
jgi:hypothetical protein